MVKLTITNMLKKLFIFLIKYIPVMQMAGIIVNNILYCLDIFKDYTIIFDILFGNSISCIMLFFICSYVFRFCMWHRMILCANLLNLMIILLDYLINFNISNLSMILLYVTIDFIFLLIIIIHKFKCKS